MAKSTDEDQEKQEDMKIKKPITPHLSDDVMIKILTRLRAKELNQIRYVCKQWNNIIRDPYFIKQHSLNSEYGVIVQISPGDDVRFINMKGGNIYEYNIDTILKGGIVATCDGLVLLQLDGLWSLKFYIINLTTRENLELPLCSERPGRESYAIDYIPSRNEYKVARLLGGEEGDSKWDLACEVLIVNGCDKLQWKSIDAPDVDMTKCFGYRPISVNGVVYWVEYPRHMVLCLDLSDDKFHQTPLPKISLSKGGFIGMGNYLSFLKYTAPEDLDVWVLKDFCKGEWVKQQTISVRSKIIECMPICSFENGDVIVFRKRKTLWAYNAKLQMWTKLGNAERIYFWGSHMSSIVFPKAQCTRSVM
ncbi:hypothetical protein IFM89_023273 [Coptis chinensis]|uniref:F-box domain-containing protein n=1 Tax=Coptis chinensis TaxID=261450 RepID=A0A835LN71_9MAGN|nr:hypothetical protein IFM89_023273 [Coptis chinensis]